MWNVRLWHKADKLDWARDVSPRANVERLYETLNHDPRHKDLLLLLSEPLAARQFPDWSMAYIGPNQWAKQAAGPPSREPAGARRLLALMGQTLNRG